MMRLSVTCWCEENILSVPIDMIKQGLTYPCRIERCISIGAANGVQRPTRRGTGRATAMGVSEMRRST